VAKLMLPLTLTRRVVTASAFPTVSTGFAGGGVGAAELEPLVGRDPADRLVGPLVVVVLHPCVEAGLGQVGEHLSVGLSYMTGSAVLGDRHSRRGIARPAFSWDPAPGISEAPGVQTTDTRQLTSDTDGPPVFTQGVDHSRWSGRRKLEHSTPCTRPRFER
jgi:hypothetical protein